MAGELSLKTPSTGLVTLVPTDTATDKTITLPATTGTMVVQDGTNTTTINNLAYTGTLTGGTGVVNIGSGQVYKDASGRLLVGSTTARANLFNSTVTASLQVEGTSADNSTVLTLRNTDTAAAGPFYILARARGAAVGSTTVIQNGDVTGTLSFQGSDGTEFVETARIQSVVNGVPGANDMPGALIFSTTADGAASSTEAMRIVANGNVGIGTVSPVNKLDVLGDVTVGGFYRNADVTVVGAAGMLLNLGARSGSTLTAGAAIGAQLDNPATTGVLQFYTRTANALTEKARIDSSGNLLVGQSSTANPGIGNTTTGAAINGSLGIGYFSRASDASLVINTNADGLIALICRSGSVVGSISVTASTASYNTSSDYRLKENVAPMTGALAKVQQLKPCTYTWKADGSAGQGFIAHELQAVVPDCVTGTKDAVDKDGNPRYQGVDTSFLVATLTAAIQELTARLEVLENK